MPPYLCDLEQNTVSWVSVSSSHKWSAFAFSTLSTYYVTVTSKWKQRNVIKLAHSLARETERKNDQSQIWSLLYYIGYRRSREGRRLNQPAGVQRISKEATVTLIFQVNWELARRKMRQRRGKRACRDSGRTRVKSQKHTTAWQEWATVKCWKVICVPSISQGGFRDQLSGCIHRKCSVNFKAPYTCSNVKDYY